MVVEIFKNACLSRPMNTSSLVADFKDHEDQRMIADSEMNYTRVSSFFGRTVAAKFPSPRMEARLPVNLL